ncbi:MAG: GatB/YqeY domain-containing protein [Candidatus Pacebacteria bacterium]|nr:GatB/YqeY domain-containing protein [Candidatus Paceibacterota bacterium]
MQLQEKIKNDMRDAMRAKDEIKRDTLRGAMTSITNELIATGKKPTDPAEDALVLAVLKRLSKQRKDSAEQFEKGGRPELAQKEIAELAIIEAYLPQMASREQVEAAAKQVVESQGRDASKMGILIGQTMKALGGNADGAVVKEVIAELLK